MAFTYAHGDHGVPERTYSVGAFEQNRIPMSPMGHIELSRIRAFRHELLEMETVTATAQAVLHQPLREPVPIGQVMLDYRGSFYTSKLAA